LCHACDPSFVTATYSGTRRESFPLMIYLFNSAFRGLYRQNVLNTLFLPVGATNDYRYSAGPDRRNVEPATLKALQRMRRGEKVAIIYIDRFQSGGYGYHPLRLGRLAGVTLDGTKIYVRVQLQEVISARVGGFSSRLFDTLSTQGIPRLTDGNAQAENDGNYAIIGDSVFDDMQPYLTGDEAWLQTTEFLSSTQAFKTTATEHVIFARASLAKAGAKKPAKSKLSPDDSARFRLSRATEYKLAFTYRYPAQQSDTASRAQVEFKPSDSIRALRNTEYAISGLYDRIEIPIVPKKYAEDDAASLGFKYTTASGVEPLSPTAELQFQLAESGRFWVLTVLAILCYVIGGMLISTDSRAVLAPSIASHGVLAPKAPTPSFVASFVASIAKAKAVGVALQTIALVAVTRLMGKKAI
jgi:hypothetical protein